MIGETVGHFRLVSLLGEGGMSTVYLGERVGDFEQRVAVKVLRENVLYAGMQQRFLAEQRVLAALRHPGIVQLIDGGVTDGGIPYLVMDHVQGAALDVYCKEHALGRRERIALMIRILEAVEYAHQRFLAHCDLKFSNILVAADGVPRLLDFGISKLLQPEQFGFEAGATQIAARPYTPEFASPEQLEGRSLGAATDIYSAGVCLYILLTGAHPFESARAKPIALLQATLGAEPAAPSSVRPELRGDLDAIILKALRKEPDLRYGGAAQFAADLRNYLEGRPVEAHRGSWRYRGWKFVKRHRAATAAAALTAAALIAFGGGALWQSVRAQRSRTLAERRFEDASRLTSALLVDFYRSAQDVRGSEPVQASVIERSHETLERLAAYGAGNPALAVSLADTYWKLGGFETRKPAAATASFERGLALAEMALRRDGENREAWLVKSRLLESRGQLESAQGQTEAAARDGAAADEARKKARQ